MMKKWIYFFVLLFLFACKDDVPVSYLTPEKATVYFKKVEDICNRDGGRLWGRNLYGPLMYVDRTTRKLFANQPDAEGLLKLKDGIYNGSFPKENVVRTSSVTFGGSLFGMAVLPNEEDEYRITSRAIHSLFHCYQSALGIHSSGFNLTNMDEKPARIWLKLEWRALRKAVTSDGEDQLQAIRDALIFRGSNRETYPKFSSLENQFETYEGLATFTYTLLESDSREQYLTRLVDYLDREYNYQSYATSYGNIHGALYATLLYYKGFDFKTINNDTIDLGNLVRRQYNIELPQVCRDIAGSIAMNYNIDEIIQEEARRETAIKERLDNQTSIFTKKPVVYLELESPYFDFEPEDVQSLDTLGTLYNTIRVSDNWGKLTVDKVGCLVSNNYKYIRISAKGYKEEKNHISGEGWQLVLNDGWEIKNVDQNYIVRKLTP
jgi:hypothetical protein